MKTTLPLLSLFASFPVLATQTPDADHDKQASYQLGAKISDDCLMLSHKSCKGRRESIRFETPNGYFLSVESFSDKAQAVPLEKSFSAGHILDAHAHIDWNKQVSGELARLGKAFKPTDGSQLNVELYVGQLTGAAHLSALAEATIHPFTLKIPAVSYQVGNFPALQYGGREFSYAGHKAVAAYEYAAGGKTLFGGLRQSFGTGFQVSRQTHLLVNQFAQAGVERVYYGAGLGVAYSSGVDSKIAQTASNICQGGGILSSSRFAIVATACAQKTVKDTLYDKLIDSAGPVTNRINRGLGHLQQVADQVESKTGYGYQFPQYSSADILRGLDIESPYDAVRTSFVVAASVKIGQGHLTISRTQSLKSSRDGSCSTAISFMHSF